MSFKKSSEDYSNRPFINSVNTALEGIVHTLQSERNMRLHFLVGFLVLIGGIYFNLNPVEFMLLCFAVTFVLITEMFNTAVEHAIDFISKDYHPLSKIIKDIAAGAVFVASINALVIGYILFFRRIGDYVTKGFVSVKQSPWHLTLIVLLAVTGLVLFIKILRKEKNLLSGGMPSGHTAVAFAVWVTVTFVTENALVCILVFFLALLIAKSRIVGRIHTLWEIVAGGLLGALTALLVFQLLS